MIRSVACCVVLLLFIPGFSLGDTFHVPDDFTTIQSAIDHSVDGDVVLVGPGTYVENIDFLGKKIMVKGRTGAETTIIDGGSPIDPDFGSVVSFRSGEGEGSVLTGFTLINGSGCFVASPYNDHVGGGIFCEGSSPTISLNRITGNSAYMGGGVYAGDSSLLLFKNHISDNANHSQGDGGGVYLGEFSSARIEQCIISGNSSTHDGGGIYCAQETSHVLTGNTIRDNTAGANGGGVFAHIKAYVKCSSNQIESNAAYNGGGLYLEADSIHTLRNNVISENTAAYGGGGIYCKRSAPTLVFNTLFGNSAASGGGILCETNSRPKLRNNIVRMNSAGNGGGIHSRTNTSLELANNLIVGNTATYKGGGFFCEVSSVTLMNDTVASNSADSGGGGLYLNDSGSHSVSSTITNTIFWDNEAPEGPEGLLTNASSIEINYSNSKDYPASWSLNQGSAITGEQGLISTDPLFVDPANHNYLLQQDPCQPGVSNPCVNTGHPAFLWAGTTRTDEIRDHCPMDLGFHYPPEGPSELSVPNVYPTIKVAIDAAWDGDTISVGPGTYAENLLFGGKLLKIRSTDGPEATTIDGGTPIDPELTSVVSFVHGEGPDTVLEGFTLTNGNREQGGGILCEGSSPTLRNNVIRGNTSHQGGGIHVFHGAPMILENDISENAADEGGGIGCYYSSPWIKDNIISDNTEGEAAFGFGGGIYCYGSSPHIEGNTISGNSALYEAATCSLGGGGGISIAHVSDPLIIDNVITENISGGGGGIACGYKNCSPSIIDNRISLNLAAGEVQMRGGGGLSLGCENGILMGNLIDGNTSAYHGGGLYLNCEGMMIANNVLCDNSAARGGGMYLSELSMTLSNNTFFRNTAGEDGGGIYCINSPDLLLVNTIMWDDTAQKGPELFLGDYTGSSTVTVHHSNLQGGEANVFVGPGSALNWGVGMIDADPLFVDAGRLDFHLTYPLLAGIPERTSPSSSRSKISREIPASPTKSSIWEPTNSIRTSTAPVISYRAER